MNCAGWHRDAEGPRVGRQARRMVTAMAPVVVGSLLARCCRGSGVFFLGAADCAQGLGRCCGQVGAEVMNASRRKRTRRDKRQPWEEPEQEGEDE